MAHILGAEMARLRVHYRWILVSSHQVSQTLNGLGVNAVERQQCLDLFSDDVCGPRPITIRARDGYCAACACTITKPSPPESAFCDHVPGSESITVYRPAGSSTLGLAAQ